MIIKNKSEMHTPVVYRVLLFLSICFFIPGKANGGQSSVTFIAAGDVMLGRNIAKVQSIANRHPFQEVMSILRGGDVIFGNLESVISSQYPAYPDAYDKNKPYHFLAAAGSEKILRDAGFTILSLANNHAMDFGPDALEETRQLLQQEGIAVFGAGKDIADARKPVIISRNGLRIAFLGYGMGHAEKVYAKSKMPGIAPILSDDIQKDILNVRKKVDFIIVSVHWGKEYETVPTRQQRSLAHKIIDWRADMVIGHHPHVIQGIEIYKGKLIAYSLGNFLFDQKGNGTDKSFMLICRFSELTPDWVKVIPLDRSRVYYPRVAKGDVKKQILNEIYTLSLPLNTKSALSKIRWD